MSKRSRQNPGVPARLSSSAARFIGEGFGRRQGIRLTTAYQAAHAMRRCGIDHYNLPESARAA